MMIDMASNIADVKLHALSPAELAHWKESILRDIDTYERWNTGTHLDEDYPTTSDAIDAQARVFLAVTQLLDLLEELSVKEK